jgi:hypothetical protein
MWLEEDHGWDVGLWVVSFMSHACACRAPSSCRSQLPWFLPANGGPGSLSVVSRGGVHMRHRCVLVLEHEAHAVPCRGSISRTTCVVCGNPVPDPVQPYPSGFNNVSDGGYGQASGCVLCGGTWRQPLYCPWLVPVGTHVCWCLPPPPLCTLSYPPPRHMIYIQYQGMIKHTLMALSGVGTQADLDIIEQARLAHD